MQNQNQKRGMYRMMSYYINNTGRSTWSSYYLQDGDGGKVYENRHKMLCNARTSVIEGGKDVMKGIGR